MLFIAYHITHLPAMLFQKIPEDIFPYAFPDGKINGFFYIIIYTPCIFMGFRLHCPDFPV